MTNDNPQQSTNPALEAMAGHLQQAIAIANVMSSRNTDMITALVSKAGGEVEVTKEDLARLEAQRETHEMRVEPLDPDKPDAGFRAVYKKRPQQPLPLKPLLGPDGKPLNKTRR